jgi:membrane fusion protein, copper/silver efflux system
MPRTTSIALVVLALLATLAIGYLLGSRTALPSATVVTATTPAQTERRVLYWRDPDGKPAYAAAPTKTIAGNSYLPVFDDQEPNFADAVATPQSPAKSVSNRPAKPIYYRNPMGLPDTSPTPKKDWMGMDYIPVYEGEQQDTSTVKVSLDRVQRAGVRTAPVEMRSLSRPIRAPAVVRFDERRLRSVTLRADGYIEKLYVNTMGQLVKAGEPLFRLFSPSIISAQVDYKRAVGTASAQSRTEAAGYRQVVEQRLRNLGVPESVLAELRAKGTIPQTFDLPSPVSGVVIEKKVVEGMRMKAGDELYRIVDLGQMWIVAEVSEQDLAQIAIGAPAAVTIRAFPEKPLPGKVTFILPELDARTRTAKVRIEVPNPDGHLRNEMFADVTINAGASESDRLVVPTSALIDSGNRQVVIVDRGEGRFEPRAVKPGARGDGYVEIVEGVIAGEQVVVTANFLIDAESNLKAALAGFTAEPATAAKPEAKP